MPRTLARRASSSCGDKNDTLYAALKFRCVPSEYRNYSKKDSVGDGFCPISVSSQVSFAIVHVGAVSAKAVISLWTETQICPGQPR